MASSLLSDYYGLALGDEAEEENSAPAEATREQKMSLDHESFDADMFVSDLLQNSGMKELVQHHNRISAQKAGLDSEIQTLVYENYNKFIDATDMIREMKRHVDSMEEEMGKLVHNMDNISTSCETIENRLSDNRGKVENLVGVSRLVTRLEFLFELPGRLRKSIQYGAHAQAVKYYLVSSHILQQYKHIESFDKIRVESDAIVAGLRETLRQTVADRDVTPAEQMDTAALLVDLREPADELLAQVFSARRARLLADLSEATELHAAHAVAAAAAAGSKAGSGEGGADEEEKESAEQGDEGDEGDQKEEEEEEEEEKGAPDLLRTLNARFVEPLALFVDTFLGCFVRPCEGAQGNKKKMAARRACLEEARTGLARFTREVAGEYLAVARVELLRQAELGGRGVASAQVEGLAQVLLAFRRGVESVHMLVPEAGLRERAEDLHEHTTRHAVESAAAAAHASVVEYLQGLVAAAADGRMPAGKTVARELRTRLTGALDSVLPLLAPKHGGARSGSRQLMQLDLARGHLHSLLGWAADVLGMGARPSGDGDSYVLDPLPPHPVAGPETPPVVYLLMSKACEALHSTELGACIKHFNDSFPPTKAFPAVTVRDAELRVLVQRVVDTAASLRERFVEAHAVRLDAIARTHLLAQQQGDVADAVSPLVSALWRPSLRVRKEAIALFPLPDHYRTAEIAEDADMGAGGAGGGGGGGPGSPVAAASREQALGRDMDRLFTDKVQIFGAVEASHSAPFVAVLKAVIKGLVEAIRARTLSLLEYQQVVLDAQALRRLIARTLSARDGKEPSLLLDELVSSAGDRCREAPQPPASARQAVRVFLAAEQF